MTTVEEDSRSMVLDLLIEPGIVMSALRGQLTSRLRDLGEDHRYDVLLVVTELVSNVLDHTAGTGRLRVLRANAKCEITVEVDDTSESQPMYGRSRLGETRGRGIVVVDNLSLEWGTHPLPGGGKTVFASVRCGTDETAATSCGAAE
ncbi:ATP-binding protein [Lentzea albidocapillata]|uniref:Anti-sigma regulatory factor (Ser/Thr protein kinase) n=1 Tax=Lentzea albidocapillata TaxID=40571 RepID=A0A1W2DIQ1_9PSEU|nr:ATP-binding protein [Lentzea albidocapillata]SMC96868.1 hypothetical protein SAMN05660733_03061 [Lentzea albidocapillata]